MGSSNELAHAAAISVTKNLGTIYNPLFIYGGGAENASSQAIGNEVLKLYKGKKVKYVSSRSSLTSLLMLSKTKYGAL